MTTATVEVERVPMSGPFELVEEEYRKLEGLGITEVERKLEEVLRDHFALGVVKVAALIRKLQDLGKDLSEIRVPFFQYFRKVAEGQLLPHVITRFLGSREVLRSVSNFPISEQQKVADDIPAKVVVMRHDGPSYLMIAPSQLTQQQSRQVFAEDHIRTEAEQVSWLEEHARREQRAKPSSASPVVVSQKQRCIFVTGQRIKLTAEDLADYLRQIMRS